MKTVEQQKETARKYFNNHIATGAMGEKDWEKFWLGWIVEGYKIAYNEFEELKAELKLLI